MITENDILHKQYLDICSNITLEGLEEYDIKKFLYNEVFYAQSAGWKGIIKTYLVTVMFDLKFRTQIDIERKNDELVLLSVKRNRKDHDGYWDDICKVFPDNTRITFSEKRLKNMLKDIFKCFSFVRMCQNIKYIKYVKQQLKEIKNKKHRCFLANRLLKMKKVDAFLKELDLQPKVAMCFFDGAYYENLAMQFFKNRGAVTVTNQHGQPVFKSFDYDRMNQSQILNFKCDYFLAKGEFTKKQFTKAGYNGEQIVVIDSFNKIEKREHNYNIQNAFCTFLNCVSLPNADEANKKLLEISAELSEKLGSKFYIKLHPSDSLDNYKNFTHEGLIGIIGKDVTIPEITEKIDFGIIHETSVYIDLLGYDVRSYRWDNGNVFPLVEDNNSIFKDVDELKGKIEAWFKLSDTEKEEYFTTTSAYYNGHGNAPQNIKKFIDNLLKKN